MERYDRNRQDRRRSGIGRRARALVAAGSLLGAVLLAGGRGALAGEMSCDPADPSDCTFTTKKVMACQTFGVLDNGVCVDKDGQETATYNACVGYNTTFDHRGRLYPRYKFFTPRVSVPSNSDCLPGLKRYWKYSCCELRRCGDIYDTTNDDGSPDRRVDAADALVLSQVVAGIRPPLGSQAGKAADVDGDGQLTDADVNGLVAYVGGASSHQVPPLTCKLHRPRACNIPCGDANNDGQGLDILDEQAAALFVLAEPPLPPTPCQFWATDLDANGILNQADFDAVDTAWRHGEMVPLSGCAPQ